MIFLDLISTFVFAFAGARLLVVKEHSIIVVIAGASLTAIGGGTVRELLVGHDSLFWVTNPLYPAMIMGGVLLASQYVRLSSTTACLMTGLDKIATAVFVVVGVTTATQLQCSFIEIVLMGTLTGVGGGLLRHVLIQHKWPTQIQYESVLLTGLTATLVTFLVDMNVGEFTLLTIASCIQVKDLRASTVFAPSLATSR